MYNMKDINEKLNYVHQLMKHPLINETMRNHRPRQRQKGKSSGSTSGFNMNHINELTKQMNQLLNSPLMKGFNQPNLFGSSNSANRANSVRNPSSGNTPNFDFNQVTSLMKQINQLANLDLWKMFR
jgi:hypothetical protein